ncbi:hypothetical protein IT409_00775 [Candidatus Falkowbacteria bacterium]|nr:hypothetical protein [Candidatus Falkowbacteria bacterium]
MESFEKHHEDNQHTEYLLLVGAFLFGAIFSGTFLIPSFKSLMIQKNIPQFMRGIMYAITLFFSGLASMYCTAKFMLKR